MYAEHITAQRPAIETFWTLLEEENERAALPRVPRELYKRVQSFYVTPRDFGCSGVLETLEVERSDLFAAMAPYLSSWLLNDEVTGCQVRTALEEAGKRAKYGLWGFMLQEFGGSVNQLVHLYPTRLIEIARFACRLHSATVALADNPRMRPPSYGDLQDLRVIDKTRPENASAAS